MSENKSEIASEENAAVDSLADNTCGPSDDSDPARIVFAASKVTTEKRHFSEVKMGWLRQHGNW